MFELWTVDGSPVVEFDRQVMDDIRAAALDGYLRIRHGGIEVGGVLFGLHESGRVRILAHRLLECEYASGPSFSLSQKDEAAFAGLLKSPGRDAELSGLAPVGWYHSHNRSDIFLSDSDLRIHSQYFPESWQVALVLRPRGLEGTRAGFFFRNPDGSIYAESSKKEFRIEPLPRPQKTGKTDQRAPATSTSVQPKVDPVPAAPVSVPVTDTVCTAVEVVSPVEAVTPVRRPAPRPIAVRHGRSRLAARLAVAGLVLVALTAGLTLRSNTPPPTLPALGLRLVGSNEQLSIEWNGTADFIRHIRSASLEISDGGTTQSLPLDATALHTGRVTYVRQSGNVGVRLTIQGQNSEFEERAHFIGPPVTRRELIEAVEPKPEPPPPQAEPPRRESPKHENRRQLPRIRFDVKTRPAVSLLPVDDLPRLEFFAAKTQPSALGSTMAWAPPPSPRETVRPPAPRETVRPPAAPATGRTIWTGLLKRSGILQIEGTRASTGFVSASLPDRRLRVNAYPAELADGGLIVYVPHRRSPSSESPGPQNGWNQTYFVFEPNRAREVSVLDTGKSSVTVRSERRDLSMVVIDWTAID